MSRVITYGRNHIFEARQKTLKLFISDDETFQRYHRYLPRTLYQQETVKFMKGFKLLSGLQCKENVIQDDYLLELLFSLKYMALMN